MKESEKELLTTKPLEPVKKQPRVRSAKDRDYGNKKDVMMADENEDDDFDFQFDEKDEQPTGGYYEEDDDEPGDETLYSKSFVKAFFGFNNYTEAG